MAETKETKETNGNGISSLSAGSAKRALYPQQHIHIDNTQKVLPPAKVKFSAQQIEGLEKKSKNVLRIIQLKLKVLEGLDKTGYISEACEHAGIWRTTHRNWMRSDPDYARRYTETLDNVRARRIDEIEREIRRRGIQGWEEPVFGSLGSDTQGRALGTGIVGKVKKYSDTLLIFRAKKEIPEYRDTNRQEPTVGQGGRVVINVVYDDKPHRVSVLETPRALLQQSTEESESETAREVTIVTTIE